MPPFLKRIKMKKITVLGLFDGYCGGQIALSGANVEVEKYYSSEINKPAIVAANSNWPGNIDLGDVTKWREWDIDWSSIDLLIGGSPCQGFSDAGKGLNFEDPRSKLFFEFVEILNHIKTKNPEVSFMLENVDMKKQWTGKISEYLNVEPIKIEAGLVSPCYRLRNYWCNFDVIPPADLNLNIESFIEDKFIYPASITGRRINPETGKRDDYNKSIPISQYLEVQSHGKARCVTTVSKDCLLSALPSGKYKDAYTSLDKGEDWREPTINELCQWHGIPKNYFSCVSDSQARKLIGNGWNIDVITHILKCKFG